MKLTHRLAAHSLSIADLIKGPGGVATLNINSDIARAAGRFHTEALRYLDTFDFWRRSVSSGQYRPSNGLWLPQLRAISFATAYLAAAKASRDDSEVVEQYRIDEAALIKMPTGTGKTAVIATLACCSPLAKKTLVITPRAALVRQMKFDLSFRFWQKLDALYCRYEKGEKYELHEVPTPERVASIEAEIRKGKQSPIRVFEAESYDQIYAERTGERQIFVATFNALHLILGITPPPHRSMYGREAREVAWSIRHLQEHPESEVSAALQEKHVEEFRKLVKQVDLVIVDEGHYEPAFSWAQAVRAIGSPTLIFTATPYRNDYKYFDIDGRYVFNLPWDEAVEERLIRDVEISTPAGATRVQSATRGRHGRNSYSSEDFVEEFQSELRELRKDSTGRKAIIHAGTYRSLKELQIALSTRGHDAVLVHDAFRGQERLGRGADLRRLSARERTHLLQLRFQQVAQAVDSPATIGVRIWLHQYKLLEGIDDDRFMDIWLFDGFGNARQLVQQIGRAIRRPKPDDIASGKAKLLGSSKRLDVYPGAPTVAQQTKARWQAYLSFEGYVKNNQSLAFIAETQLVASIKRAAPAVQYVAGEFRGAHMLDEELTMLDFQLPRRATVCRVIDVLPGGDREITSAMLDMLESESMEAMQLEDRFDIRSVQAPIGRGYEDARLIQYLAWDNSKLLARHHIPEWRLGVMAIVRAGIYIFLLDTEGICIDTARLGLIEPDSRELKRLFAKDVAPGSNARHSTRIVETGAAGLDISQLGIRSLTVRKQSLDESYFDLAESSQIPTWVRGFGQLGQGSAQRRLSFSRSSVADASYKYLRVSEYVKWAKLLATTMADDTIVHHRYFDRFAKEVSAPDAEGGEPKSILLDFWDILEIAVETRDDRLWDQTKIDQLLQADTCCQVLIDPSTADNEPEKIRYYFQFDQYQIDLAYIYHDAIPVSGRYSLSCKQLDETILNEKGREIERDGSLPHQRLPTSLIRLINQQQAFRVVPAMGSVVYAHSHFYEPDIDSEQLLSILEPCSQTPQVVSEKGNTRLSQKSKWSAKTLFGLVYTWFAKLDERFDIARDLHDCQLLICDDLGNERADFIAVDQDRKRVLFIHAKAENEVDPGASARKLQDVSRQAQSSLAFTSSARKMIDLAPKWQEALRIRLEDAGGALVEKPRILQKGKKLTAQNAHKELTEALANPSFSREVVMLTSGLLSRASAEKAFSIDDALSQQFIYFLAGIRTSFDRAGVRFRIVVNP